jgi:hypothetical protein
MSDPRWKDGATFIVQGEVAERLKPITVPIYVGGRYIGYRELDPFTVEEREALIGMVASLRAALAGVKRGECWCEMSTGGPFATKHSDACARAFEVMMGY